MNTSAYYLHALDSVVDLSLKDATARMAKENAYLGLSSILGAYEMEGEKSPSIRLIALPDFTMTRNKLRWRAGFSYGCVILMDRTLPPLIPVGFRPNCCGVTMLRLKCFDGDYEGTTSRLGEVVAALESIDHDDFSRGNHFLAILKRDSEYYALMHSSFAVVKRDTDNGPGLYPERSTYWVPKIRSINVSGYDFEYLYADDAQEYFRQYLKYDEMTKRLRAEAMLELFDGAEIVFNETHEGFTDIHTILLGAYASKTPFEMPIMIAPDQPVSWISIDRTIDDIAEDKTLPPVYFSPHGAGYILNDVVRAEALGASDFVYEIEYANQSIMHCRTVQGLMVSYRKNVTEYWSQGLGGCEKRFDLTPVFFAKV